VFCSGGFVRDPVSGAGPEGYAREVSCRVTVVMIEAAEQRGVDPAALADGLPFSLQHLRTRRNWIDWVSWSRLLRNAGRIWSDAELEDVADAMLRAPSLRALVAIASLVTTPQEFNSWMSRSGGRGSRRLFACVETKVRALGPDEIETVDTLPEGYPLPREHWVLRAQGQRSIPQLFGLPDARVQLEQTERGAILRVRYPRVRSLRQRIGGWLSALSWRRGVARELQEAYEELEQRCEELAEQIRARAAAEQENARWAAKVAQAQRFESLGVLAGGIAHDFNNILVGIQGNAAFLLEDVPKGSEAAITAGQIVASAERAAELTRQLLAYTGKAQVRIERVQLAKLAEQTFELVRSGVARGAVLDLASEPEDIWIEADATQVRQVLLNLVVNAVESVDAAPPVVHARTGSVEATSSYLASFIGGEQLPAGRYAYVEVSDDGCGMPPEVIARIFEPFYTTKLSGRGLGLAVTLGIVRAHGGTLRVDSSPDKGTTFRILLPISLEAPEEPDSAASETIRGSGTILVVDDEPAVRSVLEKMLREFGFQVRTAEGGRAALRIFERDPDAIRAVVLDATMPEMDGRATFAALRGISPDVPVLVCSGYAQTETADPASPGPVGFLQKPFNAASLSASLRELL
jgi:signal transduction histidine kinase